VSTDRRGTHPGTPPVLVIGGGIAGLGAAAAVRRAGFAVEVFEAEERLGGLCRSVTADGAQLEFGPHFVQRALLATAGALEGARHVTSAEGICYRGRVRDFPFGLLREPALVVSVGRAYARGLAAAAGLAARDHPRSVGDHLRAGFGRDFARAIPEPLLEKWTGEPAARLAPEMAGRLDPPELAILVNHALILLTGRSRQLERDGADYWMCPAGGAAAVCEALARGAGVAPRTGTPVTAVRVAAGRVTGLRAGGREWPAAAVIATIARAPLRALVQPAGALALPALRTRAALFVAALVARARVTAHDWIWFPEPEWPFYRISEPTRGRPGSAPAGTSLVQAEVACDLGDASWTASDAEVQARVLPRLAAAVGLPPGALRPLPVLRAPYAYPVLLEDERPLWARDPWRTPAPNLVLAGRLGEHRHALMHDAHRSGVAAARRVIDLLRNA
jgi:protoporphyrinogen oxidase